MKLIKAESDNILGKVTRRDLLRGAGALVIAGGVVSTFGATGIHLL